MEELNKITDETMEKLKNIEIPDEPLQLKDSWKDSGERLELKIRRHHSRWVRGICDLLAYSLAVGVPWVIGMRELIKAMRIIWE